MSGCKTCAHRKREMSEFPCNQCVTTATYTYLKFYRLSDSLHRTKTGDTKDE